jgi:hypothetical protein
MRRRLGNDDVRLIGFWPLGAKGAEVRRLPNECACSPESRQLSMPSTRYRGGLSPENPADVVAVALSRLCMALHGALLGLGHVHRRRQRDEKTES